MTQRILPLEGVENFRDYGDYQTAAGRRIHPGRLYRSANHAMATDADLDAIADLNLAVLVDLRRAEERTRAPNRRPAACAARVITNDIEEDPDNPDPWMKFVRGSDLSAESFRGYLFTYYREAPFKPRHVDLFSRYFRALGEAEGPVLIHCAAGKDRTGLLAALTHHLVGVHGDDIVEDYLLTNDEARFERRAPLVLQTLAEAAGREADPAVARIAMGVEAAYLDTAFKAIVEAHGALDAYLEQALGVDAALRGRIEERLLA
jgi:protein tyrosine/serine phosphatase